MSAALLAAALLTILQVSAWAYGFAGKRFFPTTFAVLALVHLFLYDLSPKGFGQPVFP